MIHIEFEEPTSLKWKDAWQKWRERCVSAQSTLNESYAIGKPLEITSLYSELKNFYFDLDGPFRGKCAYCETFVAENQPGDLDHFRPKGRISENGVIVNTLDELGEEIPHPGYYWLAYDYQNLLPACADCNRPNAQKTEKRIGKWDEFPVKGFRASKPEEESMEEPLLLNPLECENLDQHFEFNENGTVTCNTEKAQACDEVFGLNARQALIARRLEVFKSSLDIFMKYFFAVLAQQNDKLDELDAEIEDIQQGKVPFSAAGCAGIQAARNKYQRINRLIP